MRPGNAQLPIAAAILLTASFIDARSSPDPSAQSAGYIHLKTMTQCDGSNAMYEGRTMRGQFKGPWADYIKSVSLAWCTNCSATATLSNPVAKGEQSSIDVVFSGSLENRGRMGRMQVEARVQPLNLLAFVEPHNIHGVKIFPRPTISEAVYASRSDYYQTVNVELKGALLSGATAVSAKARVDATHPVALYEGGSVQVFNGTPIPSTLVGTSTALILPLYGDINASSQVIRLSLPQKLTKVSVDIEVTATGAEPCTAWGPGPGSSAVLPAKRLVTLTVQPVPPPPTVVTLPSVQSIAAVNAIVGRAAEFTITLNKGAPKVLGGMKIYWKLSPSNIFKAIAGGVPYDANGAFNEVAIDPGESVKRVKVVVASLPPGALNQGTAYIQTWIGDKTKNTAPYFFQQAFTIAK